VQNKIIDPFAENFRGKMFHQLTKIGKLCVLQRAPPSDRSVSDTGYLAIHDGQLGAGFPTTASPMYVHRLVFIGIEEHDNSKILKEFRHTRGNSNLSTHVAK
jgi:hypothetical protein